MRGRHPIHIKGMSKAMLATAVTIYGLLMSFIFSAGTRNRREGRPNPPIMTMAGHVLCGMTVGVAVLLPVWAMVDPAATKLILASL